MSTGFDDDNFDWTAGEEGAAPAATSILDFVVPSTSSATDVDATEQEAEDNKFQAPPPGSYLFEVTGFLKMPEEITKSGYVGNESVTYKPYKVAMKLKVVGASNLTMLDNLELPPSREKEKGYFQRVTKNPNGDARSAGFMNKKYEHLIKRLGFGFTTGDPIPEAANRLGNWVGKRVYANVIPGKQQIDPVTKLPKVDNRTGLPFEAKPQIELFSYREAESTVVGQSGMAGGARPAGPTGTGQTATARAGGRPDGGGGSSPIRAGAHADSFVKAGLDQL